MLSLIRILIIVSLLLPALLVGMLHWQGTPPSADISIVTLVSSVLAILLWFYLSSRFSNLYSLAEQLQEALKSGREKREEIVEPLLAHPLRGDPAYDALVEMAQRLSERRRQLRENLDRINAVLVAITHGKPLDESMNHFDLPDSDDKTLLLGSLCQLISTYHHTKQRGDAFATVLRESPIAMLITDEEYKIRSMNPAAEKLFGYSLQQATQRSLKEFFVAPPIKNHLKQVVLPGEEALAALRDGKQEVFTTIRTRHSKVNLIGLRASFGHNCLFVIRERSKEKKEHDNKAHAKPLHLQSGEGGIPIQAPVA